MNSLLEEQKKLVEEMYFKIKELKKEAADKGKKVVSVKTMDTQTYTHLMNHQSTMTDPPFNSGIDTEEPKDIQKRISGKNKMKKKLQMGQKSGKVSKQNIEIKKRINRCHQCKKEKISNENGRKSSGGFLEEIINKDTNLHDEFQKSEKQNEMDLDKRIYKR
ncbi:hypothetical protein JTB14_005526 [Gonioctena quinquepunctata]|nr:hypothetical protein JTB14_005526 [Gonioctena quinquepunctata]